MTVEHALAFLLTNKLKHVPQRPRRIGRIMKTLWRGRFRLRVAIISQLLTVTALFVATRVMILPPWVPWVLWKSRRHLLLYSGDLGLGPWVRFAIHDFFS